MYRNNIKFNKIMSHLLISIGFLTPLAYGDLSHAATQLGQGMYYDQSQISKLAQQYPSRVSKDAGYPLINNYSTLKSVFRGSQYGLANKLITSGLWWTPFLAVDKNATQIRDSDYLSPLMVIPNPLTVRANDSGISMGIPLQKPIVDNVHVDRGYENTLDLTFTTGDLTGTAPLVADYSDWMVKVQWANNNAPLLAATFVEGSPFVFVEKKNSQPTTFLRFNNSQDVKLISQTAGISLFKTRNATETTYRYYAVFTNPSAAINSWKTSSGAVITPINRGGSGNVVPSTQINLADAGTYFSVAVIPATSDADATNLGTQFQAYAYTFINKTTVTYQYNKSSAKVITDFNFITQTVYPAAVKKQPLVMLYPWQIKNLPAADKVNCLMQDECASDAGTVKTLKGTMHLYAAATSADNTASFRTEVPFNGVLPALPNGLSQTELDKLGNYSFTVPATAQLDASNPWTDTYATGKLLSREAQLIKIAHVLTGSATNPNTKYQKIRDDLLKNLKAQVTSFLTGLNYTSTCPGGAADCPRSEGAWFFTYNDDWHTMMGFPSGFFTATTLTDHAFHWGYIIDGAATIAQFDKTWAQQYGGMVNLIIRDVWNYKFESQASNDAVTLPHFRGFDPYSAISSALGMPYSLDNINEEDSAEFMNLAQAVILWGLNTEGVTFEGDDTTSQSLVDAGTYLYTTEEQGLNHYHFNQNPDSGVFPTGWSNTGTGQTYLTVGNVWGGKLDRSTYFCAAQPCYYQGIASNTLPISAGSLYLGSNPDFVNRNYVQDAKNPCSGDATNSAYCGTLLKYLALGDPTKALQYYTQYFDTQNNTPDPGESKPSIYYWIQNFKNLGTLNTQLRADTPAFAAFGSGTTTYVAAYNHENQARKVNFYRDGTLACSLENIQPGEIKSGICGAVVEPPQPPQTGPFSYTVYLGYPFKAVTINNTITCPDPVTKHPACLVKNIAGDSTMTISGSNGNLCTLAISAAGAVSPITSKSKGCSINSSPSTPTKAGTINLPGNF
ncbi:MAG: glycosyl hydrolase [Legionella sp.]|nr:glycosyl hydrolase [Legionella sp.]